MLDKLRAAEEKYNHLEVSLSDPAVVADPNRYVAVMKELKTLTPVIEKYREYLAAQTAADEARAILDGETDADLWSEVKTCESLGLVAEAIDCTVVKVSEIYLPI